jgi:hypothetical protein
VYQTLTFLCNYVSIISRVTGIAILILIQLNRRNNPTPFSGLKSEAALHTSPHGITLTVNIRGHTELHSRSTHRPTWNYTHCQRTSPSGITLTVDIQGHTELHSLSTYKATRNYTHCQHTSQHGITLTVNLQVHPELHSLSTYKPIRNYIHCQHTSPHGITLTVKRQTSHIHDREDLKSHTVKTCSDVFITSCFIAVVFNLFFVRVPPDIIYLQLCTPKVVGT